MSETLPPLPLAPEGTPLAEARPHPPGLGASSVRLFAESWAQDSGLVLFLEDSQARRRAFDGRGAPERIEGYSPFTDPELRPTLLADPEAMRLYAGSGSPEESAYITQHAERLRSREQLLEMGGAFWSRMAAGMVTPEALLTAPLGIGPLTAVGRAGRAAQAAGRTAGLTAAGTAVEVTAREGQLPEDIAPNPLAEIALASLFGAALGGAAGAISRADLHAATARHAAAHDAADGLRTPGVDEAEVAKANAEARSAAEAFLAGRGGAEGEARRPAASARSGADEVGSAPAISGTLEDPAVANRIAAIWQRIAPQNTTVEIGDTGPISKGLSHGPVVRLARWLETDEAVVTTRHEAIHSLFDAGVLNKAEVETLVQTALREDWMARHKVDERWAAHRLSEQARIEESIAEEFALWKRQRDAGAEPTGPVAAFFARLWEALSRLLDGIRGDASLDAERVFARIERGDVAARTPTNPEFDEAGTYIAWFSQDMTRHVEMHWDRSQMYDPAYQAGEYEPPEWDAPAASPSAQAAPSAPATPSDSQRIAGGSGAGRVRWQQLPWYMLKNNRFTGVMGESLARWASELVKDPGLRMVGTSVATSVEAAAQQYGYRYHQAVSEQDRAYFKYAGYDPEQAGPVRARLEQARQSLPTILGVELGAAPEGKMSMAAFEAEVFRAITLGEHEIPEVMQAATHWRDNFFAPFEQELAESGVSVSAKYRAESAAAVQREIDGRTPRLKQLEALVADEDKGGLPFGPIKERYASLLEAEQGRQAAAQARLKAVAELAPARETYVPHRWLKAKVAEKRDALVGRIARHWDNEKHPSTWAPSTVRAEIAVSHILRDDIGTVLERAIYASEKLRGAPDDAALYTARGHAAETRRLLAESAPDRMGVEWRSALAQRQIHPATEGLGKAVEDALEDAAIPGDIEVMVRQILGANEDASAPDDFADAARPGHAKERAINVPSWLVVDYLDTSLKHLGADYARRMGTAIEMSRSQGDPSMLNRLAEVEMRLLDEVREGRGELAEVDAVLQAANDIRDRLLGTFRIPEDPSATSIRALRFLSNTATMAQLGGALFSNIADLGRVIMAHGMKNVLLGAFESAARSRATWQLAGDEAAKAGGALEMTLLARQRELLELRDISADASLIERIVDQGARNMQFVNLVAPWTQMMQRFSGSLHQSEMIELAVRSRAGTLDAEGATRMAAYGIDPAMAERLAGAWEGAGAQRGGRLYLANTDQWENGLAREFRAMLATAVDSSVMRPGIADRPNFMSAPMWQTVLLYKGFAMTATQRLLMAGLQQRDARVLSGMLSTVAIAWLIAGPAGGPYDDHPILSPERLFQAIDRSGVMGIMGDLNNATEMLTGNALGLRPLLQMDPPTFAKDPTWAQRTQTITGAATAPLLSVIWAFTAPEASGDERAGAIRRSLPGQNLIWLEGGFRALAREAGSLIPDTE